MLNYILHVTNIFYNLFSACKFTEGNNRVAKFFSTHYDFQNLALRMKIGGAKEGDELYYFSDNVILEGQA